MLLELKGLTKHSAGLAAVSKFDMHLSKGEIVGLIGPQWCGKEHDIEGLVKAGAVDF